MHQKVIGANYFVIVKLLQANTNATKEEQLNYNQKQRTDISVNSNSGHPNFVKNKMHFRGIDSTGRSWTTVEFYVYMAPDNIKDTDQ